MDHSDTNSITIKLYLGAHKTATTHLQGILMANREILADNQVKLSCPRDVRGEWLPAFFKFCNHGDLAALEKVRSLAPSNGTWILTEENIAGVSNDFKNLPGMYPRNAERVACLHKVFPDADFEFYFSIRSYDSFYRSAYSEVIRNRGYLKFGEFYDEDRYADNSWFTMVKDVVNIIPESKITLWKFEDFRTLQSELVKRLSGFENPDTLIEAYKPETTRPSLSQKTVDVLDSLSPILDRNESLKLVERINQAYPVGENYSPLSTFDTKTSEQLKKQYEKDVESIKREFKSINFLEA